MKRGKEGRTVGGVKVARSVEFEFREGGLEETALGRRLLGSAGQFRDGILALETARVQGVGEDLGVLHGAHDIEVGLGDGRVGLGVID